MSQNEKRDTAESIYTLPKKWSGARRLAEPATTALRIELPTVGNKTSHLLRGDK